jgi:hypothetical protein
VADSVADGASSSGETEINTRAPDRPAVTEVNTPPQPLQWAGVAVAALVLSGGTAWYLGYVDFHATFGWFGIRSGLIRLSTADYVANGVGVLTEPIVVSSVIAFCSLITLRAFAAITRAYRGTTGRKAAAIACVGVGLVMLGGGIAGIFDVVVYSTRDAIPPALVAGGVALIWRGGTELGRLTGRPSSPASSSSRNVDLVIDLGV